MISLIWLNKNISGQGAGGFLLQVQPESHDSRHADRGLQQAGRGNSQGFYHQGAVCMTVKTSFVDPDPNWIQIQSGQWIRIQEGKNDPQEF
jgi:hypothetical protein